MAQASFNIDDFLGEAPEQPSFNIDDFLGEAPPPTRPASPTGLKHTAAKPEHRDAYRSAAFDYDIPEIFMADWAQLESAQDAKAEGPDTGNGRGTAKGGFQFLDATSAEQGITDPYDIVQSSSSAAKYLRQHLNTFDGDVEKSIGAYHSGIGNVRKAVSDGGEDWLNHLGPEGQKYVRHLAPLFLDAQGSTAKKDPDSWWGAFIKTVQNVPTSLKKGTSAAIMAMAETRPQFTSMGGDMQSPTAQANFERSLEGYEQAVAEARAKGEIPGQKMYAAAKADLEANAVNAGGSFGKQLMADAVLAIGEMAPILTLSFLTKSKSMGAALMGTYVAGHKYGESRGDGRSVQDSVFDGLFFGATEGSMEALPLGILIKPGGKFLPRVFKATAAEAVQEFFTEVFQSGYDIAIIDENMSLGEAMANTDYWANASYAALVGSVVGGSLAAVSHPFVMERKKDPEKPRPVLTARGAVGFAKQRQEDLEGAPSLTPEQKVELEALRGIQGNAKAIADTYALKLAPEGMVELALKDFKPELTQEDLDSPIQDADILRGKELIQAALAGTEANKILAEWGFPKIGTSVDVQMDKGQRGATVLDVWIENNIEGVNLQFEDGTTLSEPIDFLEGRITERTGEAETQTDATQEAGPAGETDAEILAESEPEPTEAELAAREEEDINYETSIDGETGEITVWWDGSIIGKAKTEAEADAIIDRDMAGEAPEGQAPAEPTQAEPQAATKAEFKPREYYDGDTQSIARDLKAGVSSAIESASTEMARGASKSDTLVPVPGKDGTAKATLALANAIAAKSGAKVADVLESNATAGQYATKKAGGAALTTEQIGTKLKGDRPEGRVLLVDNVLATGNTMKAAQAAVGGESAPLVFANDSTANTEVRQDTAKTDVPSTGLDTKRLDQVRDIMPKSMLAQNDRIAEAQKLFEEDPTDPTGAIGGILEAVSSDLRQQHGPIADVIDEIVAQWDARDTATDAITAPAKDYPKPNEHGVYSKLKAEKLSFASSKKERPGGAARVFVIEVGAGEWVASSSYEFNTGNMQGSASGLSKSGGIFTSRDEAVRSLLEGLKRSLSGSVNRGRDSGWNERQGEAATKLIAQVDADLAKLSPANKPPSTKPPAEPEKPTEAADKEAAKEQAFKDQMQKIIADKLLALDKEAEVARKKDAVDGAFKDTTNSILDTAAAIKKIAEASPDALLGVIKLKAKAWINAERKRANESGETDRVEALESLLDGGALSEQFDEEWFRSIHHEAVRKHGQNEKADEAKKDRAPSGKKHGSTGESLRRWFDGANTKSGSLLDYYNEINKFTNRAGLFSIEDLIGANATPGTLRYLEKVRSVLPTYSDRLKAEFGTWSGEASISDVLSQRDDTPEDRDLMKQLASEYVDLMERIAEGMQGHSSIEAAARALRKIDTAIKTGEKRPFGTSDIAYWAWPLNGDRPHQYHPLGRLLADEANETKIGTRKTPIRRTRKDIKDLKREGMDDVRKGKNMAPADLKAEFGFADITVGNYVTSAQEQGHVNKSYEAFADLAKLLGWTNKDMSFAGDLHYAIGALGSGKWSAHYHPGQKSADGKSVVQVINLTNTKGDGALAHEFGHAIDYNLRNNRTGPVDPAIAWIVKRLKTAPADDHMDSIERKVKSFLKGNLYYPGMRRLGPIAMAKEYLNREEVRARHGGGGPGTNYAKEARRGDNNSKKAYWAKNEELFARAFEAYIFDKLGERQNEYLVTDFVADSTIDTPAHRFVPYPQGKERERFNKMFDQLIEAMSWKDGKLTVDQKIVDAALGEGAALAKQIKEMALNLDAMDQEIKQEAADAVAAAAQAKTDAEAAASQQLRDEIAAADESKKDPADMTFEEQMLTMTPDELRDEINKIFEAYDEEHADKQAEEQVEAETTAPVEHEIPTTTKRDAKIAGMRGLAKDVADLYAIWNIDQDFVSHDNMSFFADYADKRFGGTRADGVYETKDAYDAMELGVNMAIRDAWPILSMYKSGQVIALLERLTDSLPTQSNRSEKQLQYQQFSTPPAYSFVAAWAAKITQNDRVLEPSAGTGSLLIHAQTQNASTIANELDIGRSQTLAELKPDLLMAEDGRYIGNILKLQEKPTVVLMNPPFSSDAKRGAKNKTMRGAEHVESGLAALQEGGRLVAIVGKGMARDTPTFKDWWAKIDKQYTVRAVIEVDGKVYRKYGTSFDNVVIVIDKSGRATIDSDIVGGRVDTLTDLAKKLEGVRDARKQPTSRQSIGRGEAESTAPEPVSGPTVTPPTDDALPDDRGTRPDAGTGKPARGPTDRTGSGRPGKSDAVDEGGRDSGRGGTQGPRTGGTRTGGATNTTPGDSGTKPKLSAGDVAASAAKHGVSFSANTLKGLAELFNSKGKASSFPPGWDEDSYARAKPYFEAAAQDLLKAKADIKVLIEILLDLARQVGWGNDVIMRFAMDRQEEMQTGNLRKPPPVEVEEEVNPPVVNDGGPKEAKDLTEEVYDIYVAKQAMKGSQPHRADLAESSAMGDVNLPKVDYVPNLPPELLASGDISDAQSEFIVLAGAAHSKMLPAISVDDAEINRLFGVDDGSGVEYRAGILNGDGTGFGKSRELLGVIMDNMRRGRKKALFISANAGLLNDLKKDWKGLGQNPNALFRLGTDAPKATEGILFTTYATLGTSLGAVSKAGTTEYVAGRRVREGGGDTPSSNREGTLELTSDGKTVKVLWDGRKEAVTQPISSVIPIGEKPQIENIRKKQILDWLGEDFDGVIIFDEAHMMANSLTAEGGFRGGGKPSARAIASIELAQALPGARVVYATATAAQDVRNLAYMDRLGLWGPGTAFADKTAFIAAFDGDVAGMELVAKDMKAMGMYMARTISMNGLGHEEIVHKLSEDQIEIYNEISKAWRIILNNIQSFMESTGAAQDNNTVSAVQSLIWGFQQRFFARLITTMKMPSIIADAEERIANGEAVIFQLVGTGEAVTERAIARQVANKTPIEEIDLSQKDDLIEMVARAFPVQLFEDDGDGGSVAVTAADGSPVLDPAAVEARDALLTNLKDIRIPDGPLDILINHFGPDNIAEVTGRKKRVVRHKDGTVTYDSTPNQEAEIGAFQDGKKMALAFSAAGGTGKGYHADMARINQAKRYQYVVDAGWSATAVTQALGRSHRTNQKQPPVLILTRTEIAAEKRFTSSIARRLDSLGALTKGSRKTGGGGMYGPEDNLENEYAEAALQDTLKAIAKKEVEGIEPDDLLNELGINVLGADGTINDSVDLQVKKFLNRLLSVPLTKMDTYFNAFYSRLEVAVETAKAAGTFDMGVENLVADKVTVAHRETVYTDERTGVEAEYIKLEMTDPFRFRSLQDVMGMENDFRQLLFFATNKKSGRTFAYFTAPDLTRIVQGRGQQVVRRYRRVGINASIFGSSLVDQDHHKTDGYKANETKVDPKDIRAIWEKEISEAPQTRTWNEHMIVGAVLPIWDRLKGRTKIYRTIADGERFLGRVIHASDLEQTLNNLGAGGQKIDFTAKQIIERIKSGYGYSLSNQWSLVRKKVGGEWRVRILGPGFGASGRMAEQLGAIKEIISNESFYFANDAVIDRMMSSNIDIVAERSPGDDYSLDGPPKVSDISQLTNRPPPNIQDASVRRDQMKLDELGASIMRIDKWMEEAGTMFKAASGYFKGASSPNRDGTEFRDKNMNDSIRKIAFQTKQNPDTYMANVVALDEAMSEAMLRRGFLKQHEIDLAEEIDGRIKRKEAGSEVYSLSDDPDSAPVGDLSAVKAELLTRLADIGIADDVVLNIVDVIFNKEGEAVPDARGRHVGTAQGSLIEIATKFAKTQGMGTLNHEIIHALRSMGLIKDAEWRSLERTAKADKPLMDMIETKYADQDLTDEKMLEEAIAEMHRLWVSGDLRAKGFIRVAFERIRAFFEALANAFRGNGFNSADSVFNAINRGEVGRRGQAQPVPGQRPQPAFSQDHPLGLYSGLLKAARGLKQAKGAADQMLALLKKQPGVKRAELDAVDVEGWIAAKGGTITKDELVTFIEANGVKIVEITKKSERDDIVSDAEVEAAFTDAGFWIEPDVDPYSGVYYYEKLDDDGERTGEAVDFDELPDDLQDIVNRLSADDSGEPKYKQYTLGGGTNYREVLMTLPVRMTADYKAGRIAGLKKQRDTHLQILKDFEVADMGRPDLIKSRNVKIDLLNEEIAKIEAAPVGENYIGSHYSEPNVIVHLRLTDRIGPNGEKILLIEEIQSDLHKEGRKKGYSDLSIVPLEKAANEKMKPLHTEAINILKRNGFLGFDYVGEAVNAVLGHEDFASRWELDSERDAERLTQFRGAYWEWRNLKNKLPSESGAIPDAPFKGNAWTELAMKRAIRLAAEGGYDMLAWTTGDQQADRYNLSEKLRSIDYEPNGKNFDVLAIGLNGDTVFSRLAVSPDDLEGLVGKDIAEKIINGDGELFQFPKDTKRRSLTDDNLKVGGEGMKSFYDNLLLNTLRKVAKKLDKSVKVGVSNIGSTKLPMRVQSQLSAGYRGAVQVKSSNMGDWYIVKNGQWSVESWDTEAEAIAAVEHPQPRWGIAIDYSRNMDQWRSTGSSLRSEWRLEAAYGVFNTKAEAQERLDQMLEMQKREGEVHAVTITNKMANAAMEGQEMFALNDRRPPGSTFGFDPALASRFRAPPGPPVGPNGQQPLFEDGFASVDETLIDYVRYKLQDRYIDLRRLQDAVGPIPDDQNAYVAEELYHGKAELEIEEAREQSMTPLIEAINAEGISVEEAGEYLYARHAKERNEEMQKRNPRFQEEGGGSGMLDEEADEILAHYSGNAGMAEIARLVDSITAKHRNLLVSSGLEKADTVAAWEETWRYYVPLKGLPGDEKAMPSPGQGRGFDVRGKTKMALGRKSRANNIIANVLAQYEIDIIRAQKAEVGRSLLRFVEANPDENVWEVDKVQHEARIDRKTGLVVYRPSKRYKLADNVMVVKVEGVEHHITFHGNRGQRIVSSMKNMGAEKSGSFVRSFASINRMLAMVNTSLNPEFIVSNLLRDMQTAGFNLAGTEANAVKGRILKDIGKAWRGIRQSQSGPHIFHGEPGEWARHYERFRRAGGKTGWIDAHNDVDRLHQTLSKELLRLERGGVSATGVIKKLGAFVEAENTAIENAVRLSAFVHATAMGMSEIKAASLAKNLTVNFNRRGEYGAVMNSFYLFYNASVQGNIRMMQALKSPKVRKMVAGIVVFAAMLDVLNRILGDDDDDGIPKYDKIPPWVKERNMIFMNPWSEEGYFKIPLPWGYNVFHVLGQQIGAASSSAMGLMPDYKPIDSAYSLLSAVLGAFNPLGSDATLGQFISPTATDPIVSLSENLDWAGRPIRPADNPFEGAPGPDSQKYWSSTGEIPRWVTEKLNELTGGSEVRPGVLDISPTTFEYLYDFSTGGAGRFVANIVDAPLKLAIDGEVETYRIPFARQLYGTIGNRATQEKFYENLEQVYYVEKELELAAETKDRDLRLKLMSDHGPYLKARLHAKQASKVLRALRKERDMIKARSMSEPLRRLKLKKVEDTMEREMLKFNLRIRNYQEGER